MSSVDVGTRAGAGLGVVAAGVGATTPAVVVAATVAAAGVVAGTVVAAAVLWFRWEVIGLMGRCRACQD